VLTLQPSSPFELLTAALDRLAEATRASGAAVLDGSDCLWCWSSSVRIDDDTPFELLERAIESTKKPLARGGHLDLVHRQDAPYFVARSFAGIYVLLVWFEESFDATQTRTVMNVTLPKIEALTLALPPTDGPSTTAGAARVRGKR
jgi:hypothetical protein